MKAERTQDSKTEPSRKDHLNTPDPGLTISDRKELIQEYEHLTGDDAYTPLGKPKRAYTFWLEEKMLIVLEND